MCTHTHTNTNTVVCRGVDYINTSKVEENLSDYFVTEKAPRSAIGATKDGDLMLVQVGAQYL